MSLADAVDLVLYAFTHGNNGSIFVQKAPAATIETLAKAILELMGRPAHPIEIIGTRHGESIRSSIGREEMACGRSGRLLPSASDRRDLNYAKYVDRAKRLTQTHMVNTTTRTIPID